MPPGSAKSKKAKAQWQTEFNTEPEPPDSESEYETEPDLNSEEDGYESDEEVLKEAIAALRLLKVNSKFNWPFPLPPAVRIMISLYSIY